MPSLFLSQATNTNPTRKCFDQAQIDQVYKGLKQNDYLKVRLEKTEKALNSSEQIVSEQKNIIISKDKMINLKNETIENNIFICDKEKEIKDIEIKRLNDVLNFNKAVSKKEKRKSFWNGTKLGVAGGIILTTAAVFLIK